MSDQTLPNDPYDFSAKELTDLPPITETNHETYESFLNWGKCELFYAGQHFGPDNISQIYTKTIRFLFDEGQRIQDYTIKKLGTAGIEERKPDSPKDKIIGDYCLKTDPHNNPKKFNYLQKIFKGIDDEITNKYSFRLSERTPVFTMTIKKGSKDAEFFECVESNDPKFPNPKTREAVEVYFNNEYSYAAKDGHRVVFFRNKDSAPETYARDNDKELVLAKLTMQKYASRIRGLDPLIRRQLRTQISDSVHANYHGCYLSRDEFKEYGDSPWGKNTHPDGGKNCWCYDEDGEGQIHMYVSGCFGGIALTSFCLNNYGDDGNYFEVYYKIGRGKSSKSSESSSSSKSTAGLKAIQNEYNPNIIYYGPPGTGKTRRAKIKAIELVAGKRVNGKSDEEKLKIADDCLDKKGTDYDGLIRLVQFHPSYSYNDFIETINVNGGYKDKVFKEFANEAGKHKDKVYVLIIDEINRANTAEVLGELLFGLEYRNTEFSTSLSSMQKHEEFSVPDNLYVIGTMNTADRSLQNLDYAVRRRFKFDRIDSTAPDPIEGTVDGHYYKISSGKFFLKDIYTIVKDDVENSVARGIDPNDILPGISYFVANPDETDPEKPDRDHFLYVLQYQLIPLLKEYAKDGMFTNRKILNRVSDIEGFDGFESKDAPDTLMNMLKEGTYHKRLEEVYDKFINTKVNL